MIEILRKADDIPPDELEQAKIDFELKRLEFVELEEKLERAKLVAPFDGTIVSVIVRQGRSSGKPIRPVMVIADLTNSPLQLSSATATREGRRRYGCHRRYQCPWPIRGQGRSVCRLRRTITTITIPLNPWNPGGNQDRESIDDYMIVDFEDFPERAARSTPLSVQVIIAPPENVAVIPPAALRTSVRPLLCASRRGRRHEARSRCGDRVTIGNAGRNYQRIGTRTESSG